MHFDSIIKGARFDTATARDLTVYRDPNTVGHFYMINLVYFSNMELYSRKYSDAVDILVRVGGQLKLIFVIIALIIFEYNEDSYLHLVYKYALNIKKKHKWSNFLRGNTLKDTIPYSHYKKV